MEHLLCSVKLRDKATEGQVLGPVWACHPSRTGISDGLKPTSNSWSHELGIVAVPGNRRSLFLL